MATLIFVKLHSRAVNDDGIATGNTPYNHYRSNNTAQCGNVTEQFNSRAEIDISSYLRCRKHLTSYLLRKLSLAYSKSPCSRQNSVISRIYVIHMKEVFVAHVGASSSVRFSSHECSLHGTVLGVVTRCILNGLLTNNEGQCIRLGIGCLCVHYHH